MKSPGNREPLSVVSKEYITKANDSDLFVIADLDNTIVDKKLALYHYTCGRIVCVRRFVYPTR